MASSPGNIPDLPSAPPHLSDHRTATTDHKILPYHTPLIIVCIYNFWGISPDQIGNLPGPKQGIPRACGGAMFDGIGKFPIWNREIPCLVSGSPDSK